MTRPDGGGGVARPLIEMKDFRRVALAPGEARRMEFALTPAKLSSQGEGGAFTLTPGRHEIMVGPSSAKHQKTTLEVIAR